MRYIGVDVGKKRCQACIMDEEGEILDEFPFTNTWEGIQALLEKTGDTKSKAVVESTGNLWLRIYEALEGHGVEVKLANPYKTKAIASARIKTDRLSSRILAHLLRADLIAECYVAPREVRQVRALLRQRASMVKMRTMAIEPGPQPPGQVRAQLPVERRLRRRRIGVAAGIGAGSCGQVYTGLSSQAPGVPRRRDRVPGLQDSGPCHGKRGRAARGRI